MSPYFHNIIVYAVSLSRQIPEDKFYYKTDSYFLRVTTTAQMFMYPII